MSKYNELMNELKLVVAEMKSSEEDCQSIIDSDEDRKLYCSALKAAHGIDRVRLESLIEKFGGNRPVSIEMSGDDRTISSEFDIDGDFSHLPCTPIRMLNECLLLLCFNHKHNSLSSFFWGSDEDVHSENLAYRQLCSLFNFDINEDDEWGGFLNKATVIERSEYSIEKLLSLFSSQLPSGDDLYLAVIDSPEFGDKRSLIKDEALINKIGIEIVNLDTIKNRGWNSFAIAQLELMDRFDGTFDFGAENRTIFKLK